MPAWVSRLRPRLRDVVGVDLGGSGVKAVRLRCDGAGNVTVVAADLLPAMRPPPDGGTAEQTLRLPKPLQARAGAVCYTSAYSVCKLLTLPGGPEKVAETVFSDLLGLPRQTTFRCCHSVLGGESRNDVQVLAVAVPESEAVWLAGFFGKGGPALCAAEIAGLAALNAYLHGPGAAATGCDLVVDAGAEVTTLALFFKSRPTVIRQFAQGANAVVRQVMSDLRIDEATAHEVLGVGSIDVRSSINAVYDVFLRQLALAIDFTERRAGQRLERVLMSGGMTGNGDWREALRAIAGLAPETWSPWAGMTVAPGAVSERAARPGVCFAAATGAALAILEVP
jgi:Tfp pilus assembly PilM family ATPase